MTSTDDKDYPKINIHAHLRRNQDLRARMEIWDEWNVQHVCCLCLSEQFAWTEAQHQYYSNQDYLDIRAEYGERILGFAAVEMTCEKISTPRDIERFQDQGFTGLKFIDNSFPFSDQRYFPLYEKAQALGMPGLFHTGFLGLDTPENERRFRIMSENLRPYHLEAVARCFPDFKIIGAHLGGPFYHESLLLIEVFENVFYDFSGGGGSVPHVRGVLGAMLPHAGLDTDMADPEQNRALFWFTKLCFGTDNPEPTIWVPNSEQIMDRLEVPLQLRRDFYWNNAARLLGLEERQA